MRILIAILSSRHDEKFWESMSKFLPQVEKKYNVEVIQITDCLISEGREEAADRCVKGNFDCLLFLDDDHSGHRIEMLDALVKADEFVCAMQCFSRYWPYLPNLMDYTGSTDPRALYTQKMNPKLYDYYNLVGFGMTLIKKKTFELLKKPYFVAQGKNCKEDNYFSNQLQKVGIKPMGYAGDILAHGDVNKMTYPSMFQKYYKEAEKQVAIDYPGQPMNKIMLMV